MTVRCELMGDVRLVGTGPMVLVEVLLINTSEQISLVESVWLTRDGKEFVPCQTISDVHCDAVALRAAIDMLRGYEFAGFPIVLSAASSQRVTVRKQPVTRDLFGMWGGHVDVDTEPDCQERGWLFADLSACEGDYGGDWDVRIPLGKVARWRR